MKTRESIPRKLILIIVLIISTLISYAQEESMPGMSSPFATEGYVIFSNGDTIYGMVRQKMKYVENNPVVIVFKNRNGVSTEYNAADIKGFGNNIQVWEEDNPIPVSLGTEDYLTLPSYKKKIPVFMHRLLDGRITVFQNRSSAIITSSEIEKTSKMDGVGFSYTSDDGLSVGLRYRTKARVIRERSHFTSYYVFKDGGDYFKVDKDNYDELFGTLFGDCQAIDLELNNNPDLRKFKYFMLLTEIYNQMCYGDLMI